MRHSTGTLSSSGRQHRISRLRAARNGIPLPPDYLILQQGLDTVQSLLETWG